MSTNAYSIVRGNQAEHYGGLGLKGNLVTGSGVVLGTGGNGTGDDVGIEDRTTNRVSLTSHL